MQVCTMCNDSRAPVRVLRRFPERRHRKDASAATRRWRAVRWGCAARTVSHSLMTRALCCTRLRRAAPALRPAAPPAGGRVMTWGPLLCSLPGPLRPPSRCAGPAWERRARAAAATAPRRSLRRVHAGCACRESGPGQRCRLAAPLSAAAGAAARHRPGFARGRRGLTRHAARARTGLGRCRC